jgi:outer membrane protein assembly factor BamE (lipoprotein component of BamABCDE complex)
MKNIGNLVLAAFLATSLSGCVIMAGDHDSDKHSMNSVEKENRAVISELALQTTRSRVLTKLGAPNFSEAFMKGDDEYRVLYYRTQRLHADGDTTKDETTPLIFKNDKLVGWGEDSLAKLK